MSDSTSRPQMRLNRVEHDPFAGGAVDRVVPMTESQQEIWTSVKLGDDANCAFNESIALTLDGPLDRQALAFGFDDVVARHEALRATCSSDGKTLSIARSMPLAIPLDDCSGFDEDEADSHLADVLQYEATSPFDLEYGPLIRARLVRLAPARHVLVVTGHHIVCDGWSIGVILEDLARFYNARKKNIAAGLAPAHGFGDYALAQARRRQQGLDLADVEYWLSVFQTPPDPLELPLEGRRPPLRTFAADRYDHVLSPALVAGLKKLAGRNGVTFMTVMLSGFAMFLYRLSNQNDLVVGVPAAGQFSSGQHSLVGHCVSLMPIRCRIEPDQPVAANLKQFRGIMLDAFEHQEFTYGSLLKQLTLERDPGRPPLVTTVFNIDTGIDALDFDNLAASVRTPPRRFENFELFVNATEVDGALELECTYNTDLFTRDAIRRHFDGFTVLLTGMADDPQAAPASLPILTAEQNALWQEMNDTAQPCDLSRGVAGMIEERVRLAPDAIAALHGTDRMTYAQLESRANQLARRLLQAGASSGSYIGICLPRGLDMVVSLLAVMKAGAAYVPLDPDYPTMRLKFMAEDAGVELVLTIAELTSALQVDGIQKIYLDDNSQFVDLGGSALPHAIEPEAIVYMIYTSGSTGQPKGVPITQRSLANFLASMAGRPGICEVDRLLAVTTLSFDIAALELLLPLTVGAQVIIADRQTASDGQQLVELLSASGATVMQATPATWHMLLAADWQGTPGLKALCGGEVLPRPLAEALLARADEVWNMYGPTETTVWSTCCRVNTGNGDVPIGTPIANTTVSVLDAHGQPVPLGVAGELYIGGLGVSPGYHALPELTARHFVGDGAATDGARLYRTGDSVRLGADRQLYYLGRLDNQVKVRGFRIELGEIEMALAVHPQIARSVVVARSAGQGDTRLVAYFVATDGHGPMDRELRAFIRERLPDYMVPQHFVAMDDLPLTPAGKVDRRALPDPVSSHGPHEAVHEPPSTLNETVVAEIWCRALGVDRVGVHDNFFDLGGHSLLATQVLAQVRKRLGVALSLRAFFEQPTVSGLAVLADRQADPSHGDASQAIAVRTNREHARLSLQQQRLWYIEELEPGSTVYNLPAAFRIFGQLDTALLSASIDSIIARHDVLRTAIVNLPQGPQQRILPSLTFDLPIVDLSALVPAEREQLLAEKLRHETKTPWALASDSLFRATLFVMDRDEHVFFFMPHHAIWDGWSFDIFLRELKEIYEALVAGGEPRLPRLPVQYADFAEWQRKWADSGALEKQLSFWKRKLHGVLPVLDLPTDKPRPAVMTYDNAASEEFALPRSLTDRLTELARQEGATLFMILLAAFNVLLHRYASGQRDLLVGIPISGRHLPETTDLIGFFVNTLVIRTDVDPAASFAALLRQTRKACLEAFNHQDAPFERLIEILKPVRDRSRSPLFQVMFAYQDVRNRSSDLGELRLEQINVARAGVQSDIDFWVRLSDTGIAGGFEYNADLFEPASMRQMLAHYQQILVAIVADMEVPVGAIDLLEDGQLRELLDTLSGSPLAVTYTAPVHELFARQVVSTPSAVAVVCGDQTLSYRDLASRAGAFAGLVRRAGGCAGDLVGIHVERSIDMLAALLGVLEAGCAYLPLDPDYPAERLAMMIEDADPRLVITEHTLQAALPSSVSRVLLEELVASRTGSDEQPRRVDPESLAYVIFTSGSTGRPKGVEIPHRAVSIFLQSMQQEPGLTADDVLLAVTTLSFDISVLELFLPLITGARVVLADKATISDPHALRDLMLRSGTTVMQATPVTWRMLLADGWQGDGRLKALCGGEPLPLDLASRLLECCGSLWNMYGPTETTVWSTCNRVSGEDLPPPIGRPVAGTRIYVLDDELRPVPIGVPGELYIGGSGVGRGYRGRPDLTAERFLVDPFTSATEQGSDGWFYRTGDLVRLRLDGMLVYLSRRDDQVKVRGFRIELGEIEAALADHRAVAQAVVVCREQRPGDVRLLAYILPASTGSWSPAELRDHLRATLPEYMVPLHFAEIAVVPLTPAGKVDRRGLPHVDLDGLAPGNAPAAPQTDTEERLATIWRDVLRTDGIGIHDDFFAVGGHSLLAVELFSAMRACFGVELPLAVLFDAPTIHALGRRVDVAVYAAGASSGGADPEAENEEFTF